MDWSAQSLYNHTLLLRCNHTLREIPNKWCPLRILSRKFLNAEPAHILPLHNMCIFGTSVRGYVQLSAICRILWVVMGKIVNFGVHLVPNKLSGPCR